MGFFCGWCSSSEVLLFFCSIFCRFVADLQLIGECAVAAVSRLLEQASGKISWELLFLGTLVVSFSVSGASLWRHFTVSSDRQLLLPTCVVVISSLWIETPKMGKWKFMTSGNIRKLLCLWRRIGVVHWREVSRIVRGDNQRLGHVMWRGKWGLQLFEIISRQSPVFQPGVLAIARGLLLVDYLNHRCWRWTSLRVVHPLDFTPWCSSMWFPWYYWGGLKYVKSDCMALVARVKSTNAQVVFFSILPVRWKCSGGKGLIH